MKTSNSVLVLNRKNRMKIQISVFSQYIHKLKMTLKFFFKWLLHENAQLCPNLINLVCLSSKKEHPVYIKVWKFHIPGVNHLRKICTTKSHGFHQESLEILLQSTETYWIHGNLPEFLWNPIGIPLESHQNFTEIPRYPTGIPHACTP